MEVLKFLEKLRTPFFDKLFSVLTLLGDETAFIAVALIIFWCVSKKYGYYILGVGFAGTATNQFLKLAFKIPRPWIVDKNFTIVESAREGATGYSFPSGHTQTAIGLYGGTFAITKNKWIRSLMIVLCLLVPLSRMYLGVHTPLDVGVSILISIFFVLIFKPIADASEEKPIFMFLMLLSVALLCFVYTCFAVFTPFKDVDTANLESAIKKAYTILGASVGLLVAYPIERRFINFRTSAKWYVQIIKVAIGLGLLLAIKTYVKIPLELIFGKNLISNAVRYFILVIFGVLVYPLIFKLFDKKRAENG